MSYEYDSRYYQRPRHDSHYTSRDSTAYAYSRHDQTLAEAREQLADMRQSNPYTSSYNTYSAYEPRTSPPRESAPHSYRPHLQKRTWPPSPSVEDEREALAKEAPSSVGSSGQAEGEPPINTRGTVDQDSLLDEIEQPRVVQDHDRRFVLVSETSSEDHGTHTTSTLRDRRRRSFAERGGMSHINTDVPDPPLFVERERTPYGYSKPQKESTAPSTAEYMRSPEPMTPSRPRPSESRHDSYTTSRSSKKEYVFDSESETDSTTHLRTERKPARYSFVKSDLQREDLRTNLRETHERPESHRRDSGQRPLPTIRKGDSSGSSKEYSNAQSPRSSSSSLNSTRKSRPVPVDTIYANNDQLIDVFMPPEEHYQFDHSTVGSPRDSYVDIPRASSPSVPGSPYTRELPSRPRRQDPEIVEEPARTTRTRSDSLRSQDGRRDRSSRRTASMDRPLPDCPRSVKSGPYDDWYALQGHKNFNICPSCYEGVFAGTPFDVDFKQIWLGDWPAERTCDFSSPWTRLAWLLTVKQRRTSLDLIYAIADIMDYVVSPCPGDREAGAERNVSWYGIPNQRDGTHIANFAICSSDRRMIEALLPSLRGCFTKIPRGYIDSSETCSLRTSSSRFAKYLDLLVELDREAELSGQLPDLNRFIKLIRENSFKGECARSRTLFRKPWHFVPSLPEFTVCEQCYDELIWPATQSKSVTSPIPHLFNKSIQLVPGEDPDVGSSCCLWSKRMREVWRETLKYDDFSYLKSQARERKRAEAKYMKNRKQIAEWLGDAPKGSRKYAEAEDAMRELKKSWYTYE
ncbi:unnamed protein product [Alternaria alternata]